jgi:hypothetical protein
MYSNIRLVLVVICTFISVVKTQKWTGTYAWNDQCKSNYCCCYAGTLTVINSGPNIVFTSDTRGCGSSRSSVTYSYPDGYSFSATGTRGAKITYTLSGDSNTLTAQNNAYGYCSGKATRTSGGINVYPSIISFVFILVGLWIFALN